MFERYTEKARHTILFARREAGQFCSAYIQSEHLLLGVLRADQSLANTFLHSPETVKGLYQQIAGPTGIREKRSFSEDMPLSNESKRILAYAAEEADSLSHNFPGTGHLLLGILREQHCFAAKLLRERGIGLEMAREQIASTPQEQLGAPQEQVSTPPRQPERTFQSPGLPPGYTSHKLLYNQSSETLILELRTSPASVRPTRLFTRHKDKEAYEQIGSPAENVSYESPVTCESFPVVVFNSVKRGKRYEWEGTYSFNLITRELAVCVCPEKLRLSEPHRGLRILQLVSLSEDNRTIYVNIGVEPISSRETGVCYLAKVDLADQRVTLLSQLLNDWF
jgi:Clp amino terminal domain, pathogenicity island component